MPESMRNHTMRRRAAGLALAAVLAAGALFAAAPALAQEEGGMKQAQANVADTASLQRGARLFFNYCSGCHSLKYVSYSRLSEDLGLSKDEVLKNLAPPGAKIGDQVVSSMPADGAQHWLGKAPPDLSLEARAKGPDWIFNYLRSFYLDPSATVGWNNTVFPNASMPNPLWELQGVQVAQRAAAKPGEEGKVEKLELAKKGALSPEAFDGAARDLTAFLQYVGEPAALKRYKVGVFAILYLVLFTFIAFLLKHEYWKDVH